jgi:hypothetical protein
MPTPKRWKSSLPSRTGPQAGARLRTICQRRIEIPSFGNPRGQIRSGVPIRQRRLSKSPARHARVLPSLSSDRGNPDLRCVVHLGAHAAWKDVGMKLFNDGWAERADRVEEDGCWPLFGT